MSQKSNASRTLVTAALIAAAYAALTYVSAAMDLPTERCSSDCRRRCACLPLSPRLLYRG